MAVMWPDSGAHLFDRGAQKDLGTLGERRGREGFRHVLHEVVSRRGAGLEALVVSLDALDAVETKGTPVLFRRIPRNEVPEGPDANQAQRLHPSLGLRAIARAVGDVSHQSLAARAREGRHVREIQSPWTIAEFEHRSGERAQVLARPGR